MVTEAFILRISCRKPVSPPHNKYAATIVISMKQKAVGSPEAINSIRLPKMIISISHHSNDTYPISFLVTGAPDFVQYP